MRLPAMHDAPRRQGERRRNTVLVTLNSEYHCRDDRCVAVRNRRTGEFLPAHEAIGMRLGGGIRYDHDGGIAQVSQPDDLFAGERVCFSAKNGEGIHDVVTSALIAVGRPAKEDVSHYAAVAGGAS
jgi:hypothetical protein